MDISPNVFSFLKYKKVILSCPNLSDLEWKSRRVIRLHSTHQERLTVTGDF